MTHTERFTLNPAHYNGKIELRDVEQEVASRLLPRFGPAKPLHIDFETTMAFQKGVAVLAVNAVCEMGDVGI